MAIEIWVNIGSSNSLVPDGTKPLLEPILTYKLTHKSNDIGRGHVVNVRSTVIDNWKSYVATMKV